MYIIKNNVCLLCNQPYSDGVSDHGKASLPCGHILGRSCIQNYFLEFPTTRDCPVCVLHLSAAKCFYKAVNKPTPNLEYEDVEDDEKNVKLDPKPLKNEVCFMPDMGHLSRQDGSSFRDDIFKKL
uniref:RING-type domain-containing protein n=1 Tax=Parastrongyloides trichosuri TaxID=131310 RepID=A0A0N4Z399_PARTI